MARTTRSSSSVKPRSDLLASQVRVPLSTGFNATHQVCIIRLLTFVNYQPERPRSNPINEMDPVRKSFPATHLSALPIVHRAQGAHCAQLIAKGLGGAVSIRNRNSSGTPVSELDRFRE